LHLVNREKLHLFMICSPFLTRLSTADLSSPNHSMSVQTKIGTEKIKNFSHVGPHPRVRPA
jgi:hypothetical protein